ncbi:endonuclease-reverse transcriptase [Plakobranchus ocellatus]|uniref:Endonuclease-reverse transcriptase n=1 Tax=Plakobranchus ocellatus TaxID=259542 RepID=A0AAV3YXW9_9GAST|nr:endonuclease-reverse transcriptase [Plakobranchus ocellatus]
MIDALEDHKGTVSIGGRIIINLRLADDIEALAGKEEELASLVDSLDKIDIAYSMEISAEKTKLMNNNSNGISAYMRISEQKLETVNKIKYLGAIVADEGLKPEILSRIAQTTAALINMGILKMCPPFQIWLNYTCTIIIESYHQSNLTVPINF